MKTIGLIGGMSWESSIEYYRIILVQAGDRTIELFPTTRIHAEAAVRAACNIDDSDP